MNHENNNRLADPETLLQCPYDKTHMIRVLRWQNHMVKCRRNHPTQDYKTCPFNAKHEMPAVELPYHLQVCPDQVVIHDEIAHKITKDLPNGNVNKGNTEMPASVDQTSTLVSEDWEDEVKRPPVDGFVGAANTNLTLAQRREYRQLCKELHDLEQNNQPTEMILARMKALKSGGSNSINVSSSNESAPPANETPQPAEPRMPRGLPEVDRRAMAGVQKQPSAPDSAQRKQRIAAVFGRGSNTKDSTSNSPGQLASRPVLQENYDILLRMSAGRGVPPPK